jgi:hypothetical protein
MYDREMKFSIFHFVFGGLHYNKILVTLGGLNLRANFEVGGLCVYLCVRGRGVSFSSTVVFCTLIERYY